MKYILTLLFLYSAAGAAAPLDLSQALATARGQSPELQKAQSARQEAGWRKTEAFSTYLPRIDANSSYLLDYKYMFTDINFAGNPVSFPNIVPTSLFDIRAQWSLFDGLAGTDRYRSARRFDDAARDELAWAEFKIGRNVTLEYYRALASRELLRVAESNLKTLQDHLREVRLFKKSGLSTNYDVLRVEVQVSEAESEIINTQDNLAVAESHLAEVLGQDEAVEPVGKLPEIKAEYADRPGLEVAQRKDLAALAERVEALDLAATAAARHWVPRFGAFGVYQYYNNRNDGFDDWGNYRNAYQFGLNLTWNLFDGFADIAKHRQAVEQRTQSEKSLRQAQLKTRLEADRWARKFKYFCSVYKARQNDVTKSRESVRLAQEGRKVGARTNTDLLDAESELFRAQAGAVTAQLGAIEALINLELSQGRTLFAFE